MKRKWKLFINFLRDKKKKNIFLIVHELVRCFFQENEIPIYYFTRLLYRKGRNDYLDYMGTKRLKEVQYCTRLNNINSRQILDNKLSFNNHFKKFDIAIPNVLGYNFESNFIFIDDVCNFYELFDLKKHEKIFIKKQTGYGGFGAFVIKKEDVSNHSRMNEIIKFLSNGNYIFQEFIEQHIKLCHLNPYSLNTIRIDTFNNNGNIEIISALMRFGRNNSIVDNASSGGCFVGIDLETGRLKEKAFEDLGYGINEYQYHPNTKVLFKDFHIPYFDEVIYIVKLAASNIDGKLIGWDVGISKDGPILIEGNIAYGCDMSEMVNGGYYNNKVFKEVLSILLK